MGVEGRKRWAASEHVWPSTRSSISSSSASAGTACAATTAVTRHDATLQLTTVAQKRGFTVFHCPAHRTVLANRPFLHDVQRQIRRSHHEHILIYSCETPRKQVWQWATTLADGRRILHREHPFFSSDPPKRLIERIEGLTVSFQDEEQTTLPDVLHRVRTALLPDSELNLFARYPTYAAQSDRLAMAMKRGEPGALQVFVKFHIPLARKSSRMLIRWFDMDPEDAEQTAMIGLLEAARRFDPDRGYQFSTYAGYWIRNACQRYGLEWGLPLHVPTHYFWTCYKLEFIETELLAAHGQYEARRRFAEELEEAGVSPEQWRHYQLARHFCRFSEMDRRQRRSWTSRTAPNRKPTKKTPLGRPWNALWSRSIPGTPRILEVALRHRPAGMHASGDRGNARPDAGARPPDPGCRGEEADWHFAKE